MKEGEKKEMNGDNNEQIEYKKKSLKRDRKVRQYYFQLFSSKECNRREKKERKKRKEREERPRTDAPL